MQSSSVQTLWRERQEVSRGRAPPAPAGTRTGRQLTFIIDLAVPVNVGLPDHLVHLLIGQLLTQVRHDMAQLCGADVPVAVLHVGGQTKALSVRRSSAQRFLGGQWERDPSMGPVSHLPWHRQGLPVVAEQAGNGVGTGTWPPQVVTPVRRGVPRALLSCSLPECQRPWGKPAHLVKDTEGLSDLLLAVRVLHLSGHHGQELGEVNGPVPCEVGEGGRCSGPGPEETTPGP